MRKSQVLVSGAGPTGLVLALWLAKAGIAVRIIDKTAEPGTTSRAIIMHARNLEFYEQLGIANLAVDGGVTFASAQLWVGGRPVARVSFAEPGKGLSPYPYLLIFPQDAQERMLIGELERAGVRVERETELLSFEASGEGIRARLRRGGDEEICEAAYLAGCDGAHSPIREQLGVGFGGGSYDDVYYVADVAVSGPVSDGQLHGALDDADFLAVFPMKGAGNVRFVGAVLSELQSKGEFGWEDVSGRIMAHLGVTVNEVRWFSTYHVHHRVAGAFRRGRVFLLGDAAHVHSPVGGQGMNTGIGDAVNLAWKLAAVLQGRAGESILETYEPERIAFARRLVQTTDRVFQFVSARGALATRVRLTVVPIVLPLLLGLTAMRRVFFRMVSQIAIRYPQSSLSVGSAGARKVQAGDRLPWIDENFAPLSTREWQLHVYGEAAPAVRDLCAERGLDLRVFPWRAQMRRAGFARDATYLIRPDGYLGLADGTGQAGPIARYLDERGIRLNPRAAAG